MKYDYKIGGQVKISDKWYEITEVEEDDDTYTVEIEFTCGDRMWMHSKLIQDYEPPEEVCMDALVFTDPDHITVHFSTGLVKTFTTEQLLKLQAL